MSLKNKKIFVVLTLLLISLFSISCNENKLKLNAEELKNCARWNWIALTDTKKWSKKAIKNRDARTTIYCSKDFRTMGDLDDSLHHLQ